MPSYTNPSVAALMRTEAGKTVLRAWKTVLRAWKQADMVLPVVNTRYNSNIRIVFIPVVRAVMPGPDRASLTTTHFL